MPRASPREFLKGSGNVTVNELRGTIHHPSLPAPLVLEPSSIKLNIPDSNQPIENDVKLVYRLGNDPAGTITASGKIDAIENNRVQIDKLTAKVNGPAMLGADDRRSRYDDNMRVLA